MKNHTKSPLFLVSFGVLLFVGSMHLDVVLRFLRNVFELILPIVIGLLLAFVLNVPMRGFEHLLEKCCSKWRNKPTQRTLRTLSLLLTLVCIVLVVALACTLAIPALVNSAKSILPLVKAKWPEWMELLASHDIDLSTFTEWINSLNLEQLTDNASLILGSAVNAATSTLSGISSFVIGLIIAVYILLSKQTLSRQIRKLVCANLKPASVERIYAIAHLTRDTYAKFLSGQCAEAIILGTMIAVSFGLFHLPYAAMVGFLTGVFAFIPYVGAFASCGISVFLALLVDPPKALLCLAVYVIVQFIETQFIYPHVVGGSVGLTPIWTLIAALIGGKLFGVIGIVFFIPLTATLYALLRDDTNQKLKQKKIDTSGISPEKEIIK